MSITLNLLTIAVLYNRYNLYLYILQKLRYGTKCIFFMKMIKFTYIFIIKTSI